MNKSFAISRHPEDNFGANAELIIVGGSQLLPGQPTQPQTAASILAPALESVGIRWRVGIQMLYKKINVELMVVADEADAVVAELDAALDLMEERHTLFSGGLEITTFEHSGTPKRSALAHTIGAGKTVAVALRTTRQSVAAALRAVV